MSEAVTATYRLPKAEQHSGHSRIRKLNAASQVSSAELAAETTREASSQTYLTIRYLVDAPLVDDAYRAYAYFRWVDDMLDDGQLNLGERLVFLARQREIIAGCYQGKKPNGLSPEEQMVVDLIHSNPVENNGLNKYIHEMMAVMAIDVARKDRYISQAVLDEYTRCLATAVTEAMHYFIGHDDGSPHDETRYLAVTGAHITHMLRDMIEDTGTGYYNIPQGFLEEQGISPTNVDDASFQAWVIGRVQVARECFMAGRGYMARVENLRCRLAGFAYIARFELVLDAIEKDGYRLRAAYPERKNKRAKLKMIWSALTQTAASILEGGAEPAGITKQTLELV